MKLRLYTPAAIPLIAFAALAQPRPASAVPEGLADRQLLLLREAAHVVREVGDDLWPGWARSSKTTLVIASEREYLVGLPSGRKAPDGFSATDQSFMGAPVYQRPRSLPATLRAVVRLDETTHAAAVGEWRPEIESPNEWVVTLVEQWFRVLRLERGVRLADEGAELSGYEFPFDDPDVGNALMLLGQALYDFWNVGAQLPRTAARTFLAETAWAALQNLEAILTLKHGEQAYRFFQLQTSSEGVPRYSGMLVAREIARAEARNGYHYTRGFDDLPEQRSYSRMWEESMHTRFWLIRTSTQPGERDMTTFHAIGHGLAEMLDAVHPDWKRRYFEAGVPLDTLIAESLHPESRAAIRR